MISKWNLGLTLATLSFLLMISPVRGAESLLIAVASEDKEATLVSDFAARSRYYLLFDETLEMVQVLENPFPSKGELAAPQVIDYLAQKGVGVIVAGHFGPVMIEAMRKRGIRDFQYSGVAQEAAERAANLLNPRQGKARFHQDSACNPQVEMLPFINIERACEAGQYSNNDLNEN
jgi:predicted Fe-Mo cluster-binding NifX family protein